MSEKENQANKAENIRKARLAAELRANLVKRKAQARQRKAESSVPAQDKKDD